jgi:hypothetical protein
MDQRNRGGYVPACTYCCCLWWRATNAQRAAELATENEKKAREAAEEQMRIAESRRLARGVFLRAPTISSAQSIACQWDLSAKDPAANPLHGLLEKVNREERIISPALEAALFADGIDLVETDFFGRLHPQCKHPGNLRLLSNAHCIVDLLKDGLKTVASLRVCLPARIAHPA